jgi:hypothetical protein
MSIAWLALASLIALGAAHMFRYAPLGTGSIEAAYVWDRWTHRVCLTNIYTPKPQCTPDDFGIR